MDTRYLYVMGSESGVGKSTVCQGILAQLLVQGWSPSQLAYIKPMTKCVEKQAVARFCERTHIDCIDISSLVFKNGFSKHFIDGMTKNSNALKTEILTAIDNISQGKSIVIIDGIGGPTVGSVIGVSNADIAKALSCGVIFVGKPGIGAAIDDTVLCLSYMKTKGIDLIGLIYNKIPSASFSEVKKYVTKRVMQLLPNAELLGFLADNDKLAVYLEDAENEEIADWFSNSIDVIALSKWCLLEPCYSKISI